MIMTPFISYDFDVSLGLFQKTLTYGNIATIIIES